MPPPRNHRVAHSMLRSSFRYNGQLQANQRFIEGRATEARQHIRWVTWCVGGLAGLTVAAGISLVTLFLTGVVQPLRQVVCEARQFAGPATEGGPETAGDELRAVGVYLRALMSDVAQSQSRLAGAEKLATLGKLAASVAHEIRNPLTAIKMWLFSLQKSVGDDSEARRKFQFISDEIGRLESIVRNFLEFARPPRLKTGTHRIEGLVDKTLDLLRPRLQAKRISVDWTPRGELPSVTADPDQFRQVLINLLDNAAEVTPESGRISMTAAVEQDGDGRPMAVLRLADAGSGMSDEVRERIFEPFFTTKEDGTGLGLCIAARIMAQHGGRLVLESSGPAGTTFALWLPVASEEPAP
jgi:signal transduction histidine kinase